MRSLSAPTLAALAQPVVPLVQLVRMQFPGGDVAINTSNWPLTWAGVNYAAAAGLGTISPINDSPGEVKGLQFTLSGVSASMVALALDDAAEWQGVPIEIRTAILDASFQVVDAPLEWSGLGDTMSIAEDGDTCEITATAESSAVDLLRGHALMYANGDQQSLYPGDRAFEYVADQEGEPVVWPAKEWFYK